MSLLKDRLRASLFGVPVFLAIVLSAFAYSAPRTSAIGEARVALVGEDGSDTVLAHKWRIRATGARIVGGYGDNFAYDGENVRALDGHAEMTLDAAEGKAELVIELETTASSGPIRFSSGDAWSGEIRIVQRIDTNQMEMARIAEQIELHGDTGNEAPVMPNIFSYFATWGPAKIWVNGQEVIPTIGSHTMFSERARGCDGGIVNGSGEVYSPMIGDKTGFADREDAEFHFVAHTTQPDNNNFPPHTGWIHLNFSTIVVEEHPDYVEIPYKRD